MVIPICLVSRINGVVNVFENEDLLKQMGGKKMSTLKELAEKILPELLEKNTTRREVATVLGTTDSTARGLVSEFATKEPIISHHLKKGYKKAQSDDDIEGSLMTVKVLQSDINRLIARQKPHIKFLKSKGINYEL